MTRRTQVPYFDEKTRQAYGLGPDATVNDLKKARAKEQHRVICAVYGLPPETTRRKLRSIQAKAAAEGAKRMAREKI